MFATGIECSYPTIEHGRWRRDEMQSTRHYSLWQHDFELARETGITHIRYGPPLHLIFEGIGRYNWDYCDPQMAELRDHGPEPIVDLCHFGLPSWLGDFQNGDIGAALAEYAAAFAERYPWVRFYTPVNEMYVCARMSALDGIWNEQLRDEGAYGRAAWNLANASIAMSDAILKPGRTRSSSTARAANSTSRAARPACSAGGRRRERAPVPAARPDLRASAEQADARPSARPGHSRSEIERLAKREVPRRSILGVDYYEWNERLIDRSGKALALGELFGWYVIADQYWRALPPSDDAYRDQQDGRGRRAPLAVAAVA